jgi:hypothetical protein
MPDEGLLSHGIQFTVTVTYRYQFPQLTMRLAGGHTACSMQTPSSKFSMASPPPSFSVPHAAGLKLADVTSTRREAPRWKQ